MSLVDYLFKGNFISFYLFYFEKELTINLLQNHIRQKFDPTKLIAGLMDIPKEKREIGISFLKYCIEKLGCKEKTIFNILIFFLSEQENSDPLYDFLKSQEKFLMEVYYKLNFKILVFDCRKKCCILILILL